MGKGDNTGLIYPPGGGAIYNAGNTTTDLEAILKPWLSSNVGVELLGDATSSTYFA